MTSQLSMVNGECRSWLLTVPLLTIFALLSCAQGKYGIEKISAYAAERIPGNIPVDQQGEPVHQPRDTIYTVYVESSEGEILWDSAWTPGRAFAINATSLTAFPAEAGIDILTGEKILVTPRQGNQCQLLHLAAAESRSSPPKPVKSGHILLRGWKKEKVIYRQTKSILVQSIIPSV